MGGHGSDGTNAGRGDARPGDSPGDGDRRGAGTRPDPVEALDGWVRDGGDAEAHRRGRGGGDADELIASFVAWAGDQRAGAAAAGRARERWLRQQAAESATWLGTLVDAAERGDEVVLSLGGRNLVGRLAAVGADLCVLSQGRGVTLVAGSRITAVRVTGADRPPSAATGDRPPPLAVDLAGALAALAAERSPVRLATSGSEPISGTLVAVGLDVLSLRMDGSAATVHVPLAAVETVAPAR